MVSESIVLLDRKELYGCVVCNKSVKVFALYDYYDTKFAPHCTSCFMDKMRDILKRYNQVVQELEEKKNV